MNDKMIQAQGGLYTPDQLASAYAERGDKIEELSRENRHLEARLAELEELARAVTVLANWVNKDKTDSADIEDRLASLEAEVEELRGDLADAKSEAEEVRSDLDGAIERIRDAAAELASI